MTEFNPFVLYRESLLDDTAELRAIQKFVPSGSAQESIPPGSIVFPRFRSIPFGKELEDSVLSAGSTLVNSWEQYQFVSDLWAWVRLLDGLTPVAYRVDEVGSLPEGEYFIKGETNSVKHDWFGSAFAGSLSDVQRVISNLRGHSIVGNQSLVIRPFVHYRQLAVMESGQPVFHERRYFALGGQVVGSGFYWSQQRHRFDASLLAPLVDGSAESTLREAIKRIGEKINFVVIDLAEKTDGSWDVIELNDGNMSGLTGVDPSALWGNIAKLARGSSLS